MAKPRTTKSKKSAPTPLLPVPVAAFLKRRAWEGLGLGIMGAGALVLLALVTYDSADPSWNTAAGLDTPAHNFLGRRGAVVADGLLQSLGLAALFVPLILVVWGVAVTRAKSWVSRWREILWLLGGLVFFAAALSVLRFSVIPAQPHLGGFLGGLVLSKLGVLTAPVFGEWARVLVAALCGVVGFGALLRSLGLSRETWHDMIGRTFDNLADWQESRAALRQLRALDAADADDAEYRPATRTLNPVPRAERTIIAPKARPLKTGGRNDKEKQPRFSFRDMGDYVLPALNLLQTPDNKKSDVNESALKKNAELLHATLEDFAIRGDIIRVNPGPVVTLYELEPAPGLKSARVINLAGDIARSMHATSVRVAVIPGRNAIGIELPNKDRETVFLRELLASEEFEQNKGKLPIILGKDIAGAPIIADLAKMPHLLIAGTTGSGKSVGVNAMILSLLYRFSPAECRLIMIDPKMLELSVYEDIPHLLTPVVTEPKKAIVALKWAVREMEDRYRSMSKLGVRNIDGYNERIAEARDNNEVLSRRVQTGFDPETGKPVFEDQNLELKELPHIVIIVDEFADLMLVAGKDVEGAIQRLAQMARAAGIHLIMATQRPSVDVITGTIKANFPSRISYQVTSRIDSRTILGDAGAENLLGRGDLLYMAGGGRIVRVHGPFVSDGDVEKVVKHLKAQAEPDYIDDVTRDDEEAGLFGAFGGEGSGGDELYDKAVAIVSAEGKASTSFIQRHLKIGYNRAATLIEQMEKEGVISAANHVGKRDVLVGNGRR
jgi:S-DNA-T family DNA segregation ATPase FtsK/SpoIIIE